MDGTLLTPDLEISQKTIETVKNVIEKQVIITLSTGRMYLAALPFANLLQLDVPLITCNGALIKCAKTGKEYYKKTISYDNCRDIIKYCHSEGLSFSIYKDNEIFIEDTTNLYIHEEMDKAEPKIIKNISPILDNSVIKILITSRNQYKLEDHAHNLYDIYKNELTFYFSLPYFVEIVNKEANKKNALEYLANKFNIERKEIIAIGDNFNDMDMIQYAGLGVAMGNAPEYLKKEADFVTYSNDEDGVNYVLKKFVLH